MVVFCRSVHTRNTDEALGSETEIFPKFPAAPMSTPRTGTGSRKTPLIASFGNRAICDSGEEELLQEKQLYYPATNLVANSSLIRVLDQFTGPKWVREPVLHGQNESGKDFA
jgi:hypothetical protein